MKKENKSPNTSSNDGDNEFPGYPIYPPNEDIMNQKSGFRKESLSGKEKPADNIQEKPFGPGMEEETENNLTASDVTPEDLNALGNDELNTDIEDDADLKERVWAADYSAEDLDVPGADLDDAEEEIGEEDEENNFYSLGGENHDDDEHLD